MSDDRLSRAAAALCASRDQERAVLARLERCERRRYHDCWTDEGEQIFDGPVSEECNEDNAYCSRVTSIAVDCYGEPRERETPMRESEWCDACRRNLPLVAELRRLRAQRGGLYSALMRAWRASTPSDDGGEG